MPTYKTPKDRVRQPVIRPNEKWLVIYQPAETVLEKRVSVPPEYCDSMTHARLWICDDLGVPRSMADELLLEPIRR